MPYLTDILSLKQKFTRRRGNAEKQSIRKPVVEYGFLGGGFVE
jgi:hypothetical protein